MAVHLQWPFVKRGRLPNHSGDLPQEILIIPSHVPNNEFAINRGTTKCQGNITSIKLFAGNKLKNAGDILPFSLPCMTIILLQSNHAEKLIEKVNTKSNA